jgi:hypothetical protein
MAELFSNRLVLKLPDNRWVTLMYLLTTPDGKHESGGYQNRKAKWLDSVNQSNQTIVLDEDDVLWIQRQIANRKGGGWQSKIYNIFTNLHPAFRGIATLPPRSKRTK